MTPTRMKCTELVERYSKIIESNCNGLMCYIGIAGDNNRLGEYSYFFKKFKIFSLDILHKYGPSVVGDIINLPIRDSTIDVVVCIQVIEHVANLFKIPDEIWRVLRPSGYAIVDCPFNYPFHGDSDFSDYWRVTTAGMKYLFNKFNFIDLYGDDLITSCLLRKL